uniref:Alpha-2-macroglobulin n=1 Tax=Leptobrachium leishanense TaxID=445787 RepID=A0A8C5QEB8_9ANUR
MADFTFHLSDEAPLGEYKIYIPGLNNYAFTVTHYDLKNFEVDIKLPETVHRKDDSFLLGVCGSYTYGKPTHGTVEIYVCESYTNPLSDDDHTEHSDCHHFQNVQTDSNGCFTKNIDLHFFNLTTENNFVRQLTVSTAFREHGTGREEKASKTLQLGNPKLITFVDSSFSYHRGIPYTGLLRVVDKNKKPKAHEKVFLIIKNDEEKSNVPLETDDKGIAHFSVDTSAWKNEVTVTGDFQPEDEEHDGDDDDDGSQSLAYKWLYPFYSASNSHLKLQDIPGRIPCDAVQPIKVEYSINRNDLDPDSHELHIYYLFAAFGNILWSGEHVLNCKGDTSDPDIHGSFTIDLDPKGNMAQITNVLVFTSLKDGAVTGDHAMYNMKMCYKNKVKLEFSEKEVRPRGKVTLDITTEPGSMCSLRSVDTGILKVKRHEEIFHEISDEEFEHGMLWWSPVLRGMRRGAEACPGTDQNSTHFDVPFQSNVADLETFFLSSDLLLLTNTKVRKPQDCPVSEVTLRASGHQTTQLRSPLPKQPPKKSFTRKFLPSTFLYDLVNVGEDGHTQLALTTPDSITRWETDAFCLNDDGFGFVQNSELTTFQPLFIDFITPKTVVQGETFPLTALVFNYVDKCLVVGAWLSESQDIKAVRTDRENTRCICPDHSGTITWNVTATATGKLKVKVSTAATRLVAGCPRGEAELGDKDLEDSLEKTIKVKASGVEEDETKAYRICPEGDILSNAIANVEDVTNLPTGCGEQNAASFYTALRVYKYLNRTNHLTPEIEEKLRKHLSTGYQTQLTFKNKDGSYSLFPGGDGNIWLTATVVKAFSQAFRIIHINEKDIIDPLLWLKSLQLPSGCFQRQGHYYNCFVEDNKHEDIRLTAYMVTALMESKAVDEKGMLEEAVKCVKKEVNEVEDISTEALLAYMFTLWEDEDVRKHLLEDLEKKAHHTDLYTYWGEEVAYSADIETASYVALAILSHHPTAKEIEEATKIITWIVSKQNAHGGYYSTADTVLALQALTKFSKFTPIVDGDVSVTVRSLSDFQKQFIVDKDHKVLLQEASLPDIPGEYVVTAAGASCVYVQTHLHYHVRAVKNEKHFALSVSTRPAVCTYQAQTSFEVVVDVRYTGSKASSNMAIIEVELLSGYKANEKSLAKLLQILHVKKTEIKDETVIIYLDELKQDNLCLAFTITEETHVDNLQSAAVTAYDYYEPEHHAVAEYNSPCHPE